jgi:hypothetical protein
MSMGFAIPQTGRVPFTTAPCEPCRRDTPHRGDMCLVCRTAPAAVARPKLTQRQRKGRGIALLSARRDARRQEQERTQRTLEELAK